MVLLLYPLFTRNCCHIRYPQGEMAYPLSVLNIRIRCPHGFFIGICHPVSCQKLSYYCNCSLSLHTYMTPRGGGGGIKSGLNDLRDRAMKTIFKLKTVMGTEFNRNVQTTLSILDALIKPTLVIVGVASNSQKIIQFQRATSWLVNIPLVSKNKQQT